MDVVVCVTAQHREMLDQVLDLFGLVPDHDLDLMRPNQRPEDVTAVAVPSVARMLDEVRPDVVLVQGDTSTAMATALASFYRGVAVGHVEAGLRTGVRNSPFPEEMMRRLVTQIASLHFAPTVRAANNLLREHADQEGGVFLTGNTVVDAVLSISERSQALPLPFDRVAKRLILLTAHRRENLGEPLRAICRAVRSIVASHADLEVVYPVHLNPNVQRPVNEILGGNDRIHLLPPLSYGDLVRVMRESDLVLSDSGGLQEEAPVFGKPVLVLRRDTERPEAIEAGTALLVGTVEGDIVAATERLLSDDAVYQRMARAQSPFGDGHAADRIADVLLCWRRGELERVGEWRWPGSAPLAPYRALTAAT